jgi:hypothetical protein
VDAIGAVEDEDHALGRLDVPDVDAEEAKRPAARVALAVASGVIARMPATAPISVVMGATPPAR